jgi:hypothetical protein
LNLDATIGSTVTSESSSSETNVGGGEGTDYHSQGRVLKMGKEEEEEEEEEELRGVKRR